MINFILKLYYLLPHDNKFGLVGKISNRVFAKLAKLLIDKFVDFQFSRQSKFMANGLNLDYRDKKVIISLTTFPDRIENVWIVIECLFRQKYKADAIVLWLSKQQFTDFNLPKNLLDQEERGLIIKYVEDDLKSHKKYLYTFDLFPDDYVITVDDDLYYDNDFIGNLIKMKKQYSNCIPSNRCHKMLFDKMGMPLKYKKWGHNSTELLPSYFLFPTGGFGVLYEKKDFLNSFNDIKLIRQLTPYADDIWLKIQTLINDKLVVTNDKYNKDPITIKNSQIINLVKYNVQSSGNDEQLRNVFSHFKIDGINYFLNK